MHPYGQDVDRKLRAAADELINQFYDQIEDTASIHADDIAAGLDLQSFDDEVGAAAELMDVILQYFANKVKNR